MVAPGEETKARAEAKPLSAAEELGLREANDMSLPHHAEWTAGTMVRVLATLDAARAELAAAQSGATSMKAMAEQAWAERDAALTRAATAEAQAEAMRGALEKTVLALEIALQSAPSFAGMRGDAVVREARAALLAATSPGKAGET